MFTGIVEEKGKSPLYTAEGGTQILAVKARKVLKAQESVTALP